MDRDLFLLLAGAGISLVTTILTLILSYGLNQLSEKKREARSLALKKQDEIHAALTSKEVPVGVGGGILIPKVRLEKYSRRLFTKRILERNKAVLDAAGHVRVSRTGSVIAEAMRKGGYTTKKHIVPGFVGIRNKALTSIEGDEISKLLRNIEKDLGTRHIEKP